MLRGAVLYSLHAEKPPLVVTDQACGLCINTIREDEGIVLCPFIIKDPVFAVNFSLQIFS